MPCQEEIDDHIELLAVYRRLLLQYIDQQIQLGEAHTPPAVLEHIHEARKNIVRIKRVLRSWEIHVDEYPYFVDGDIGNILRLDLEAEDGTKICNPNLEDIEKVLNSLDGRNNSFAILTRLTSRSEGFVQTATDDPAIGFHLEYQDGSIHRHYAAISNTITDKITILDVISVFQLYAKGDESWKTKYSWEKQNL